MNEYLNVVRNNYANFSVRARRREFWMFSLVTTLISIVFVGLMALGGLNIYASDSLSDASPVSPMGWIFFVVYMIYALAVLVPSIAVTVRRLHDTDKSAWWLFVALIPYAGALTLFVFECLDSKPGTNKWGPNPKGVGETVKAF